MTNMVCNILKIPWKKQKKETLNTQVQIRELKQLLFLQFLCYKRWITNYFQLSMNEKKLGQNFRRIKYFIGENSTIFR